MVVKKKNGKWWVCVNFTDLNRDCLKDPFPSVLDRSVGGCNRGPSSDELLGCFPGISPDTLVSGRLGEDFFRYTHRELSFESDTFWAEECKVFLLENDNQDVRTTTRQERRGLHR